MSIAFGEDLGVEEFKLEDELFGEAFFVASMFNEFSRAESSETFLRIV